ncbi:MAG: DJ-1/PfpI family protein [Deltaproteobacteria bacterium]|nr:DJ-1/PfpI family protein [Deltaproteobacteria bacterium]
MRVLVPLPALGFDPTEAAVSWQVLREAGHQLVFATPDGRRAHADPIMLSGEGLDPWGFIPLLKKIRLIGLTLRAQAGARRCYRAMEQDEAFSSPLRYEALRAEDFDALLLPGGHAKSMRPYLESARLHEVVAAFFDAGKPVAAVCHGVVLAARSTSARTGRSVLHGRKTTALTWALERSAWRLTRYLARFWDPHYYRTYLEADGQPAGYMSVQQEVTRALAEPADFLDVPADAPHHFTKTSGLARDDARDERPAWVVVDGNYVSARWPGDVHTFAKTFDAVLKAAAG